MNEVLTEILRKKEDNVGNKCYLSNIIIGKNVKDEIEAELLSFQFSIQPLSINWDLPVTIYGIPIQYDEGIGVDRLDFIYRTSGVWKEGKYNVL